MRFYYRIILILIASGISLTLINKLYEKGNTKFYQHETERLNVLLNKDAYYDVLLIGSSRTHVHYNPKVIDSITHLSSYNFGVEGGNLLETNLWLQVYLALHQKPKVVILDLPAFAFDIERRPFFNHTIYFPYLKNDVIYNTVAKYKKISLYKYLPFLKLMEADDYNKWNALKGLTGKQDELVSLFTYKGYAENGTEVLKPGNVILHDTNTYKISGAGKKLLTTIIDSCNKKSIRLIFVYSPEYCTTDYTNKADFFNYVSEISAKNNIPFFDYRKSAICKDSTLFANPGHLNKYGANIFSEDIAENILAKPGVK